MTTPRTQAAAERVRAHLTRLYGPEAAERWLPVLLERMAASEASHTQPFVPPEQRLRPDTSVLITYPDQVHDVAEAPLRTLGRLLDGPLADTVSAVHLLPFSPATSDDGFAVADYGQVDPAYGDWSDLEALGRTRDLMFDVVVNHTSASHPWFRAWLDGDPAHSDWYIAVAPGTDVSATVRPRTSPLLTPFSGHDGVRQVWTTFSDDQVDLNYRSPAVLDAMVGVLLDYVQRGARLLRLDAVTYLWKSPGTPSVHLPETHELLRLFRTVLEAATPGVVMITETNVPHAENVSYFGGGDDEAQMVYNFALPPLTLHAFHRGDARTLRAWARELRQPGPGAAFFNFLASHDGIGVRPVEGLLAKPEILALAERVRRHGGRVSSKSDVGGGESPYELNIGLIDALADPDDPEGTGVRRMLSAHALMLAMPGVPGIYVHSLLGSRSDHERMAATGRARSINRGRFDWTRLTTELRDPHHRRRRILDGLRTLLQVRSRHASFDPASPATWPEAPPSVAAVVRSAASGAAVLCLHELGGRGVRVDGARLAGRTWPRGARDLLSGNPVADPDCTLAPYAVRWIELPA